MNASAFETTVKVGDTVEVRFTAGFRFYAAPATVVRVSDKSFSVTLNSAVGTGAYALKAGHRVNVPRYTNKLNGWSANNRIAQWVQQEVA